MKKELLTILGVAASVRILFAIPSFVDEARIYSIADASGYEILAINLIEHGTFSLSGNPPYRPELLRTPLYPLCISGIYSVFGRRSRIMVIFQLAISTLTALLVYTLGKRINPKIAFPGALLSGLSPNIAFYPTMLVTEALFAFLLLASIIFLLMSTDSGSLFKILLSGFLFGLSTLTRPIGLYFPFLITILILWMWRKNLRRGVVFLAVFLGAYLITLSPWILRNVRVCDRLIFTTAGELNIFYYHAAMVKAVREGIGVDDARRELGFEAIREAEHIGTDSSKEAQISLARARVALEYLKGSPLIYLRLHGLGFVSSHLLPLPMNPVISYLAPSGEKPLLRRSVTQDAFSLLSSGRPIQAIRFIWNERIEKMPSGALLVYIVAGAFQFGLLLGILFFLTTSSIRFKYGSVLLLSILYFTLIPGPLAGPRFRTPIEPLLVIVASCGFHSRLRKEQACKPSSVSRRGRDGDH